jgi:sugar-specific transcriptional regulator TrmB
VILVEVAGRIRFVQIIDSLMTVGLSRHEASLYVLMHREGPLTGYEAAKLSGISRSNAYPALAGLVEKGAANRIDGDTQKYIAVPAGHFCKSKQRQYEQVLRYIEQNMPVPQAAAEPFITVSGEQHILDQIKTLIETSKLRIYLASDQKLIEEVSCELADACDRGLKIVLLTGLDVQADSIRALSGRLESITIYLSVRQPGQIRLITDSEQVMTGEISLEGESTCLYSKNRALVTLFKEAMINEISLIEINNSKGSK